MTNLKLFFFLLQEHHLQRAIVTGLIIPTPEVFQVDEAGCYSRCYPGEWKVPRNLIHMQRMSNNYVIDSIVIMILKLKIYGTAFTMEQDIPDYDMDSDDERWINSQAGKLDITPLQVSISTLVIKYKHSLFLCV